MAKEKDYGEATFGRKATGALFPGIHGAVAAKKGQKLNVASRQYGSHVLGTVPGAAIVGIGAAAKNPLVMSAGQAVGVGGGAAMAVRSTNKSQRRGQFKPQKQFVSKSYDFTDAFGVERPDIIAKSWTMNYKLAESGAGGSARAFRSIKDKANNPKMNNSREKKAANQIKALKARRDFA